MTKAILWCFALYVFLILFFAVVYYRLYRNRQASFFVGADLTASQRQSLRSRSERLIRALNVLRTVLPGIANRVRSGTSLNSQAESTGNLVTAGGTFRLYKAFIPHVSKLKRRLPPQEIICIEVTDIDGTQLLVETLTTISQGSQSDEVVIDEYHQDILPRINREQERLSTLDSPGASIWNFWDFFYFSAISQTTVGFGDILPNATAVRLLVVVQILAGYGVLVVLLNIILTR